MKKIYLVLAFTCILLTISACSAGSSEAEGGVRPYQLSEDQEEILGILGISANSQIVSFDAPEGAGSMKVSAYMLADDGTWVDIGGTSIDAGGVDGALSGAMSIHFDPIEDFIAGHSENFTIGFNISSAGSYQFQSEPVSPSGPITASGGAALTGFQATDIGAETPVAIMAYGDTTRLPVYSLEHYYEPSIFDGMDVVLAVTMEFSGAS